MSYVVRGTGVRVNGLGAFNPLDPSTWEEGARQGIEEARKLLERFPPPGGRRDTPPPQPAPGFMDQKVLGLPMPLVLLGGAAAVVYFATQK